MAHFSNSGDASMIATDSKSPKIRSNLRYDGTLLDDDAIRTFLGFDILYIDVVEHIPSRIENFNKNGTRLCFDGGGL